LHDGSHTVSEVDFMELMVKWRWWSHKKRQGTY